MHFHILSFFRKGNSISNDPIFLDVDTSQILLISLLFVDNVEMINPWKLQPPTLYSSKVIEIWKFDRNGCSRVKSAILNLFSVITIVLVILSSCYLVWVSFLGVGNPKTTHRRLKNKLILGYFKISGSRCLRLERCHKIHVAR